MIDLANRLQKIMEDFLGKPAQLLLDSDEWLSIEYHCKDILVGLELREMVPLSRRIGQEFDKLLEALIDLEGDLLPARLEDNRPLWKALRNLRTTLFILVRHEKEIRKQKKQKSRKHHGKRGPDRMSLEDAWRYLTSIQAWEDVKEHNKGRSRENRIQKSQFSNKNHLTPGELDAMLAWYRKYRNKGLLPEDPRTITKNELEELFV